MSQLELTISQTENSAKNFANTCSLEPTLIIVEGRRGVGKSAVLIQLKEKLILKEGSWKATNPTLLVDSDAISLLKQASIL